jgi:hypothetical protein
MAEEHELFQQHRRAAADEIIAVLTAARDAAPTDPEKDSDG